MPRNRSEKFDAAIAKELRRLRRREALRRWWRRVNIWWRRSKVRWRARWIRWVAFWKAAAEHLKVAAQIVGYATAIAGGLATFWHFLGPLWRARDVGTAQEPATGVASTAPDFVKSSEHHEGPERR